MIGYPLILAFDSIDPSQMLAMEIDRSTLMLYTHTVVTAYQLAVYKQLKWLNIRNK